MHIGVTTPNTGLTTRKKGHLRQSGDSSYLTSNTWRGRITIDAGPFIPAGGLSRPPLSIIHEPDGCRAASLSPSLRITAGSAIRHLSYFPRGCAAPAKSAHRRPPVPGSTRTKVGRLNWKRSCSSNSHSDDALGMAPRFFRAHLRISIACNLGWTRYGGRVVLCGISSAISWGISAFNVRRDMNLYNGIM